MMKRAAENGVPEHYQQHFEDAEKALRKAERKLEAANEAYAAAANVAEAAKEKWDQEQGEDVVVSSVGGTGDPQGGGKEL